MILALGVTLEPGGRRRARHGISRSDSECDKCVRGGRSQKRTVLMTTPLRCWSAQFPCGRGCGSAQFRAGLLSFRSGLFSFRVSVRFCSASVRLLGNPRVVAGESARLCADSRRFSRLPSGTPPRRFSSFPTKTAPVEGRFCS